MTYKEKIDEIFNHHRRWLSATIFNIKPTNNTIWNNRDIESELYLILINEISEIQKEKIITATIDYIKYFIVGILKIMLVSNHSNFQKKYYTHGVNHFNQKAHGEYIEFDITAEESDWIHCTAQPNEISKDELINLYNDIIEYNKADLTDNEWLLIHELVTNQGTTLRNYSLDVVKKYFKNKNTTGKKLPHRSTDSFIYIFFYGFNKIKNYYNKQYSDGVYDTVELMTLNPKVCNDVTKEMTKHLHSLTTHSVFKHKIKPDGYGKTNKIKPVSTVTQEIGIEY